MKWLSKKSFVMISDELSKTIQLCSGSRNEQEVHKFPSPSRHVVEDRTPGMALVIAILQLPHDPQEMQNISVTAKVRLV